MVLSSAIVCDHDRRIADDRRSSFHMIADDRRHYCDLPSAICDPRSYGNQPLDRTWFYLLRSSAIVCDHDRRIADDRRPYCDLRSAIIWKPALCYNVHFRITVLVFFDFAWRHLQAVLNLDQAGIPIDVNHTPHSK